MENTYIFAITEDAKGNIWVSTNKGISCYLEGKDTFYNYGHWDNVSAGSFMSGSVAQDAAGIIYFGSINGLCSFTPEMVLEKQEAPAAVITDMKVFGLLKDKESSEELFSLNETTQVKLNYM